MAIEDTGRVRMSLPTESDYEEWAAPGFRVSLGYGYGLWRGVGKAWDWNQHTFLLRPQVKIDRYWSLGGAFEFAGQGDGLQWSASFEPTFHPIDQLGISVGAGYGGLEVNRVANGPQAEGPTVTVSHTDQDADLNVCSGSALSTLARADYLFVVGPLFSTGPFVQGNAQWTRCQLNFGGPDQETGRIPQITQWWRQQGVTFGWWLSWR